MDIKTVFPIFALVYIVMMASVIYATPDEGEERIQLKTGSTSTTVKGTIAGSQFVSYKIRAGAGQHMVVTLKTNHDGNYFNLYEPGSGPGNEAMFSATMDGLRYEGILPANGEYTLSVFLMRYAARRDEIAKYSLEITVDGEVQPDTGESVENDNIAWPSHTDASGDVPCSAGEPSFKRSCAFQVKCTLYGATIWTVNPGTKEDLRILYFENKTFSTDDGTEISWRRQGDNWWIGAGEKEFYLIPDAVI